MKTNTLLLLGVVAIGGYLLMKNRKDRQVAQAIQNGDALGGGGGGGFGGRSVPISTAQAPVVVVPTTNTSPVKPRPEKPAPEKPAKPSLTPSRPIAPTTNEAPTSKFIDFDGDFETGSGIDFDGGFVD